MHVEPWLLDRKHAGIDEAGRGPLAGPVLAAAVVLHAPIVGLNDSKKLTQKKREELHALILAQALHVEVALIEPAEIDASNILAASLKAMAQAALAIHARYPLELALIDGNQPMRGIFPFEQRAIVNGDSIVPAIMAASIVAKVERDRLMLEYDKTYPGYAFGKHKGYGTALHMAKIAELGPCPIHRMTFAPLVQGRLL
jgi:ribonuclease HII